ncbi:MAG: hypothetical protein FWE13_04525 [Firmicutes bacterium]|nr:hypothetical protein [Bacillota bacterium]
MSTTEIISVIFGTVGLLSTVIISILTIYHFNKKPMIYEIKKNAIQRSLRLLDDYMSNSDWIGKDEKPIQKKELSVEYLTIEARECYNELILACDNADLISAFNRIMFSRVFNSRQMQEYRLLCRKEIGLKNICIDNEITFINRVGKNNT